MAEKFASEEEAEKYMWSIPSCGNCKHFHGLFTCDAYPDGIPHPILDGEADHTEPLPGDHGIQYERQKE